SFRRTSKAGLISPKAKRIFSAPSTTLDWTIACSGRRLDKRSPCQGICAPRVSHHHLSIAALRNYHCAMPVETEIQAPTSIRAPRGNQITCKGWQQEAAMRMLMNNLDEEVAERPKDLVVYGGTGRAARSWEAYRAIIETLKDLASDETLLVQS